MRESSRHRYMIPRLHSSVQTVHQGLNIVHIMLYRLVQNILNRDNKVQIYLYSVHKRDLFSFYCFQISSNFNTQFFCYSLGVISKELDPFCFSFSWKDLKKKKKSRIRETSTLSTDADSRTDTNLKRLCDLSLIFFFFFKDHYSCNRLFKKLDYQLYVYLLMQLIV